MGDESWRLEEEADPLLGFEPVPRQHLMTRGWTAKKQRGFIAALRDSGSVRLATAAVGMSYEGVYKLRHAPGGADFARAWDEAVRIGARRVRDVFIDQNIHGIPETVVRGNGDVIERRRFNHRSMIWVLQHHLPEEYPGGSTTHRRGWAGEPEEPIEAVRARILQRLDAIDRQQMEEIAADPAKRAAWELLHGPQDWDGEGTS
jgi:hypothetical protein